MKRTALHTAAPRAKAAPAPGAKSTRAGLNLRQALLALRRGPCCPSTRAWQIARVVGLLLLAAAGVVFFWPIFHKLGLRACCYADWAGLCDAWAEPLPGGLLRWCAHGLMALWACPWVGAPAFVALMAGCTAAGLAAKRSGWVALLPALAGLWQVGYCGFSCWVFADASFPAAYLLFWAGLFLAMAPGVRWGVWGLAGLLLWPVVGFAAPAGVLLGACCGKGGPWGRGVRVAAAVGVALGWRCCAEGDIAWPVAAAGTLPFLFEEGSLCWNLASGLVVAGVLRGDWALGRLPARWPRAAFAAVGWGLYFGALVWGMDPLHPLYDILASERAVARNDPEAILRLPPERVVGHRMLSAYAIYALWRTGRLEERLFDYPWRVSHSASTIDTMEMDGYQLLYRYGLVQIARRWCYESIVNRGWSPQKYALLAEIALITGEDALARRYIRQLSRMPFGRKRARELEAIAAGGKAPRELQRIAELHARLSADSGSPVFEGSKKLEEGIYNRYAVLKNGNRDMVALYLCSSLLRKDTQPFLENYAVILQVWPQRPLPKVFQEALLSAATTLPPEEQPRLTADLFSPGVPQRFMAFRQSVKQVPAERLDVRALAERFGRSYWFYASFVP